MNTPLRDAVRPWPKISRECATQRAAARPACGVLLGALVSQQSNVARPRALLEEEHRA